MIRECPCCGREPSHAEFRKDEGATLYTVKTPNNKFRVACVVCEIKAIASADSMDNARERAISLWNACPDVDILRDYKVQATLKDGAVSWHPLSEKCNPTMRSMKPDIERVYTTLTDAMRHYGLPVR